MSEELRLLAYSVVLLFVLVLYQATVGIFQKGLVPMMGNRDDLPTDSVYLARLKRTVQNHVHGLVMFAPLILATSIMGVMTFWTELGARLFFYSRVVHALCYVIGIPFVRTLSWFVGLAGTAMVFLAMF